MDASFEREAPRRRGLVCSVRRSSLIVVYALLLSASSSFPREVAGFCGPSAFSPPAAAVRCHRAPFVESRVRPRRMLEAMAYIDESSGGGVGGRKGKEDLGRTGAAAEASEGEAAGTPGVDVQGANVGEENESASINERRIDYTGAGTLGDIISDEDYDDEEEVDGTAAAVTPANDTAVDRPTTNIGTDNTADPLHHRPKSPTKSGLVTSAGGTLQSRFSSRVGSPPLSPLDRIALTANGNLQRIFSSYYDAPVHVHVDRCELRRGANGVGSDGLIDWMAIGGDDSGSSPSADPPTPATWDRTVHLYVHGRTFCVASSVITVRDPECVRLVHSGAVGIGQLFRHLDKLPTFELIDAGRRWSVDESGCVDFGMGKVSGAGGTGELVRLFGGGSGKGGGGSGKGGEQDGGLWRLYALRCEELECIIREDFSSDAWEIPSPEVDHYEEHDNTF